MILEYDQKQMCFYPDLSVDGISIKSREPYEVVLPSSPMSEGYKVWIFNLEDGEHQVILEHKGGSTRVLHFDDQLTEEIDVVDSVTYPLLTHQGHEIAIHIKKVSTFRYQYELSVDGISQDTGEKVVPFQAKPSFSSRITRKWDVLLDGKRHEIYIKRNWKAYQIFVDRQLIDQKSFWKNIETSYHPFQIGSHSCAFLFQLNSNRFDYDVRLFVDEIDVDTGAKLYPFQATISRGRKWIWMFEGEKGVHTVELVRKWWGQHLIYFDQRLVGKTNVFGDQIFSFSVQEFHCQMHFGFDDFLGDHKYDLIVNQQLIDFGNRLDQKEVTEVSKKKRSFSKRLKNAILVYICGVIFLFVGQNLLFSQLLGWDEERPLDWYFIMPVGMALMYLLEIRSLRVLFALAVGILILLFGGGYIYDEWLRELFVFQ